MTYDYDDYDDYDDDDDVLFDRFEAAAVYDYDFSYDGDYRRRRLPRR